MKAAVCVPLCRSAPNLPVMECADKEENFLADLVWDANLNIANFQYQPQQEKLPPWDPSVNGGSSSCPEVCLGNAVHGFKSRPLQSTDFSKIIGRQPVIHLLQYDVAAWHVRCMETYVFVK